MDLPFSLIATCRQARPRQSVSVLAYASTSNGCYRCSWIRTPGSRPPPERPSNLVNIQPGGSDPGVTNLAPLSRRSLAC